MIKASEFFIHTLKENPIDAELISHTLMLRAGVIQQLALGIYNWLPLGLIVIRQIEHVIREEMQSIGCYELAMPNVQPAALWKKSGRWDAYGKELLRCTDRHEREYCLGPTHEEVITALVKSRLQSYQNLPIKLFQIQTKFRDEIRPRFGVMRAREFIMKDAYSFHIHDDDLHKTYQDMEQAYNKIFTRLGLHYTVVDADSGAIGGGKSREFQAITPSGEDTLVVSDLGYAANIELAPCPRADFAPTATQTRKKIHTPQCSSIADLANFLNCSSEQCLKVLVVHHKDYSHDNPKLIALALRGEDQLNKIKAQQIPEVATPLTMASEQDIALYKLTAGSIGPIDCPFDVIVDNRALSMADFACGANIKDTHFIGVNWSQDVTYTRSADLRNIKDGETCIDGSKATLVKGSEVGHIFQLGTKYSKAMHVQVTNEHGDSITPPMGCYGIGVSRIVAAFIEQSHDEKGIIWNTVLAPFAIHILPLSAKNSVQTTACSVAQTLDKAGYRVLLDDRKLRPGVLFSQADLLGMPWQIVISERNIATNKFEIIERASGKKHYIDHHHIGAFFRGKI